MGQRTLIITSDFHHKNRVGFETILTHLDWSFEYYGNNNQQRLEDYDVIYSPCHPIDASRYPKQRFVFGPHFSVFPEPRITQINAKVHNNAVYIQPSDWVNQLWASRGAEQFIPVKTFCFPVDTQRFAPLPSENEEERNGEVVIYYKRRKPEELQLVLTELNKRNIKYKIFSYTKGYEEEEYIAALQRAPYGIWVDAHESQGFATLEALACGVPLLVWSVRNMKQEILDSGRSNPSVPATSVPYWDERCGEVFHDTEEFIGTMDTKGVKQIKGVLDMFVEKVMLGMYNPRTYICEMLSIDVCADAWKQTIELQCTEEN